MGRFYDLGAAIVQARDNIKAALKGKGAAVQDNDKLAQMPAYLNSLEVEGVKDYDFDGKFEYSDDGKTVKWIAKIATVDVPAVSKIENPTDGSVLAGLRIDTLNIPATVSEIGPSAFTNSFIGTINIDRNKDAISGAPWGATHATINWTGTT